ncbi:uncharacterized protein LOC131049171 isoform X2 [Cryptomeria japonica]|uniref:uncharacterized protein LOC131049171 isoform X2 n=1 Tax=Cryptomeria japonica TaxID=3369 RepID=UPI0027DA0395|nr:uncharacterized protein LOC131049171 isoform X2 [Cryptomeria japonica]
MPVDNQMTKPHIALGHGVILSLLVTLLLLGCFVLRYHASTPSLTIFLPQHHSKKLGPLNDYVAFVSLASNDRRGWMLNPVIAAVRAGLTGGVKSCKSVHVGEIKPGGIRGNHRHLICNETFIIWGAKTIFRVLEYEDGNFVFSCWVCSLKMVGVRKVMGRCWWVQRMFWWQIVPKEGLMHWQM